MVKCPVCGAVSPETELACGVCGLPVKFFEALVHDATVAAPSTAAPDRPAPSTTPESPSSHPGDAEQAVGTGIPERGVVSNAPGGELQVAPEPIPEQGPENSAPKDEALRIGASLGMDVSGFERALEQAALEGKSASLAKARRELISAVLDRLLDRYRRLCERRDVLSTVMRTKTLDAELSAYRRALSQGELGQAEERRARSLQNVELFEASLGRIRSRLDETNQMMRALRELGGVAPNVLRPVAEAVKDPRRADPAQIERRLAQTNAFLWGLLVPRMNHEISRGLTLLNHTTAPPSRTAPIRVEIDRMAEMIRAQEIREALESHRFLHAELASLTPRPRPRAAPRFTIDEVHRS